ncbi:MAG: hypothetical protein FJ086_03515 [Deltaproteobacteria bacterium]|nr:hypothetical protein [Deltaproteobacteria bacterium]
MTTRRLLMLPAVAALSALALATAPAGPKKPVYECTRIAVPESRNFPIRGMDGKRTAPPVELSLAFQTLQFTVELPEGFAPVGGAGEHVIACRQVP